MGRLASTVKWKSFETLSFSPMEVKLFDGFESYIKQIHVVEEENLPEKVRKILEQVRVQGDSALLELTQHFDGVRLEQLRVSPKDLKNAFPAVDPELRGVLEQAAKTSGIFISARKRKVSLNTVQMDRFWAGS